MRRVVLSKEEWLEKNGFTADGFTYCIVGDDTYSIKNWLKEVGCKFNTLLKWHTAECIDLPEGFTLVRFYFPDLYEWDAKDGSACPTSNAKNIVERAAAQVMGPSLSEYMGEIGDRLRHLTAVYKSSRGFQGMYGWTNIYTFQIGEDVLVWFTTKDLQLEKGQIVDLTGTIVAHEEFRGVKTTKLNRCIIKEVD